MKKLIESEKGGVFDQLNNVFIGLAVIGVVMVVGFLIMAQAQTQIVSIDSVNTSDTSTWTSAYNASTAIQSSTAGAVNWVPIIIVVVIGGLLIGLVAVFGKRNS